MTLTVTATGLK